MLECLRRRTVRRIGGKRGALAVVWFDDLNMQVRATWRPDKGSGDPVAKGNMGTPDEGQQPQPATQKGSEH